MIDFASLQMSEILLSVGTIKIWWFFHVVHTHAFSKWALPWAHFPFFMIFLPIFCIYLSHGSIESTFCTFLFLSAWVHYGLPDPLSILVKRSLCCLSARLLLYHSDWILPTGHSTRPLHGFSDRGWYLSAGVVPSGWCFIEFNMSPRLMHGKVHRRESGCQVSVLSNLKCLIN